MEIRVKALSIAIKKNSICSHCKEWSLQENIICKLMFKISWSRLGSGMPRRDSIPKEMCINWGLKAYCFLLAKLYSSRRKNWLFFFFFPRDLVIFHYREITAFSVLQRVHVCQTLIKIHRKQHKEYTRSLAIRLLSNRYIMFVLSILYLHMDINMHMHN